MDGEVKKTGEKMSRRGERLLKTQQVQMKLEALQWGNHLAAANIKEKQRINKYFSSECCS